MSKIIISSWIIAEKFNLLDRNFREGKYSKFLPNFISNCLIKLVQNWAAKVIKETDNNEVKYHLNIRLNKWEARNKTIISKSSPLRMYLEITKKCNLKCPMCGQSFQKINHKDLEVAFLEKINGLFPFLTELSLFGFGESLVSPNFLPILNKIPKEINTRLLTNGVLMDKKIASHLVNRELNILSVSLDAASPETHKKIRGGDNFQLIIDNIHNLQQEKKRQHKKYPELHLSFVAMRSNIEELPAFLQLAKALGAVAVECAYLIVFSEELRQESLFYHRQLSNNIMLKAKNIAQELKINIYLPPLFDTNQTEKENYQFTGPCFEPWEFIYIQNDGMVIPCCTYTRIMGDFNLQSFAEIWNGDEYKKLRRELTEANLRSDECRQCINFRFRDANNPRQHFHILKNKVS